MLVFSLIGKSSEPYTRHSCKTRRLPRTRDPPNSHSSLISLTVLEKNLGRHVLQGAANQIHFFGKEHLLEDFPEPEVYHLDVQVLRIDDYVFQFDVPVHDVLLLQVVERLDQLHEDLPRNVFFKSSSLFSLVTRTSRIKNQIAS